MKKTALGAVIVSLTTGFNAFAADPGVTKDEIKLGTTLPLTGPLAFYGEMSKGARAYFNKVNDEGGINGRKITVVVEDDAYNPTKTVPATRKLVEQDKIFAMYQALGFAHTAVGKYLEQKKVPTLYLSDGSKSWDAMPNAVYGMVPWEEDGKAMGEYVAAHYAGKKVGFLFENSNLGREAIVGAKKVLEGKVQFGPEESYNPGSSNADAQTAKLMDAKVDVVLGFSVPPISASSMIFAKQKQWKPQFVISYINGDPVLLALAGPAAEGVVSSMFFKLPTEKDAGVEGHAKLLAKYFPDSKPSIVTIYGQGNAELMVESLRKAGPNLTRDAVLKAATNMKDFTCSLCLFPSTTTPTDRHPFKKLRMMVVKNGEWVPQK